MANPNPLKHPATSEPTPSAPLTALMSTTQGRVQTALDQWLPPAEQKPARLHQAMRYAALAGGKYIRPLLVYATGQSLGVDAEHLDGPACAVELVHAYSLIHDDLPAMDNDDLRRGRPTCHKAFDEATAILAGDALQTLAFEILANDPAMQADATQRLAMIEVLARASGSRGMAGGQAIDLQSVGLALTLAELEEMHRHKTGALIRASIQLAALSSKNLEPEIHNILDRYAHSIGLAFQIRDDILDVEGDTAVIGKTKGADMARNKPTYPSLLGLEGARNKALEMHHAALAAIESLGQAAEPLRWISAYIVQRSR